MEIDWGGRIPPNWRYDAVQSELIGELIGELTDRWAHRLVLLQKSGAIGSDRDNFFFFLRKVSVSKP